MDIINKNLIKIYAAQGEFEGTLYSIGHRQSELIRHKALSVKYSAFSRVEEGSRSKKPQAQIPEFFPYVASYKFEPVNLNPSHMHDRRRK